jgi:hypothetical protein
MAPTTCWPPTTCAGSITSHVRAYKRMKAGDVLEHIIFKNSDEIVRKR